MVTGRSETPLRKWQILGLFRAKSGANEDVGMCMWLKYSAPQNAIFFTDVNLASFYAFLVLF